MRQFNAMQPKPKHVTQNQLHKKWVVNLSDIALTESQNQVLQLGLNFAPKRRLKGPLFQKSLHRWNKVYVKLPQQKPLTSEAK